MSGKNFIGIDIGGTTIKAGLVDESGVVRASTRAPTPSLDLEELIQAVGSLIRGFQSQYAVAGVGLGIPGLMSTQTRKMVTSPHLPCLQGVDLESAVGARCGLPAVADNDANAGAYAEWACGAGRGLQHVIYVTLGTGLGSGIVLFGKVFRGAAGFAGELGHTMVEPGGRRCACGAVGCLETRVSGTGMVQTAIEYLKQDGPSLLSASLGKMTAESIYAAAVRGDRLSRAVFEETGRFLGMACSNLINLLNPEMIVVGGGVLASGDMLLGPARVEAARRAFGPAMTDCQIVQSQLWPDAGIIGAALLARDNS